MIRQSKLEHSLERQIKLFQISASNYEKNMRIDPLSIEISELRTMINVRNQKREKYNYSNQLSQIVWINLIDQLNINQPVRQKSVQSSNLLNLFEEILQKQNPLEFNQINQQTTGQRQNNSLQITANSLIAQSMKEDSQFILENRNILSLKIPLLIKSQKTRLINKQLLSMGLYLGQTIILNCVSLKNQDKHILDEIIQFLSQKIESFKKYSKQTQIHIIYKDFQNASSQCFNFDFYKIKNTQNLKSVISTLQKVKFKILRKLNSSFSLNDINKQKGNDFQQFQTKFNVINKILECEYTDHKFPFLNGDIFSEKNINIAIKLIQSEQNNQQLREIRQKLNLFQLNITDPRKMQLPLSEQLLKFRIQTFVKQTFTRQTFPNCKKSQKIMKALKDFEKRLQQKNEIQIQKTLKEALKNYINKQLNFSKQQSDDSLFNSESIGYKVSQFCGFLKETYLFATEDHINKFVLKQLYIEHYKTIYEKYKKLKNSVSSITASNSQELNRFKGRINNQEIQIIQLRQQNTIKCSLLKEKNQLEQKLRSQLTVQTLQISSLKQKLQDVQKQLSDQVLLKNKFQQELKIIKNIVKNNDDCYSIHQKQNSINQRQNSNYFHQIQNNLNRKLQQSTNLTQSFDHHLNSYSQEFNRRKEQLINKQNNIQQKQLFYEQKIKLLEELLKNANQKQLKNINSCTGLKKQQKIIKIQSQYQQKIKQIEKQYEVTLKKYQDHITELQKINNQKNKKIENINQQLWIIKKSQIQKQQTITSNTGKINIFQRKIDQLNRLISQKNVSLQTKNNQNQNLIDKLQHKIAKIQLLQQQNYDLKILLLKKQNTEDRKQNKSFLKFQQKRTSLSKSKCENLKQSRKIYRAQQNNKTKNKQEISACKKKGSMSQSRYCMDSQLSKLLQERKTIEKKKSECNQKQNILNKIQIKIACPKTQSKRSSLNNFNQKITYDRLNTEDVKVLKDSNKAIYSSGYIASKNTNFDECRKKLF